MKGSLLRAVVLRPVRWWLTLLRTESPRVGACARAWRVALMLPPFGALYALLRVRALAVEPLEVPTTTRLGLTFTSRLPDLIQMYLHLFGVWEPDLLTFVRRRLAPGDTFIDIGANVGAFTLPAAARVGERGRVIAIDASPAMIDDLRANLERNNLAPRVRVVHAAVSDHPGMLDLYAGPSHNVGLTSTEPHRGMRRVGGVRAAPPGDLLSDAELSAARLIKIDVEGGENRVLAGFAQLLDRLSPEVEIVVELSPHWWRESGVTSADVLRPFLAAGFHVYAVPNNYWPWRLLWSEDVSPPRRLRADLSHLTARVDVVLSRVDAETL
ncbi:MAG: FkbM family methyltransferase [Phycisphaeraceae bacterium]|nr:FkbM family methyltransferase [Phycisphaerales bacterium]QOJ18915.1 MAG: FkbM family methyltransferase [Phycisphaeraceae bacterium]